MAITRIVGLADIAQLVETGLNELSISLKSSGKITKEVVFNITDEMVDYDEMTTTKDSTDADVLFTPGLIEKIDTDIVADQDVNIYGEIYTLNFYGYYDEYEDVKTILDTYSFNEKGAYQEYNDWLIQKSVGTIDYSGKTDSNDGQAKDRFFGVMVLEYTFMDGGIHSSKVILKFDDVSVPFTNINIGKEKTPATGVFDEEEDVEIINQSQSTTYFMSGTLLKTNSKQVEIARDIREENYLNKIYSLFLDDTIIDTTTKVVLLRGNYVVAKPGVVTIDATFMKFKEGII